MRRIIGFLLLQLAALLFALQRIAGEKRELEALQSYAGMLEQLQGLLETEAPPMPELLLTLSGRCRGEAAVFIQKLSASMDTLGESSFQELWRRALSDSAPSLERDAARELEALGSVLGRYELRMQADALMDCQKSLRHQLDARQRQQPQDLRLTLGLSFSAALLLGILLI